MLYNLLATALLAPILTLAAPAPNALPAPFGYFVNNTIYATTGRESASYPRFTELEDGTILATTALSGHSPGYFPVFESRDGGASWAYISNITDQVNGVGMAAQPAITYLEKAMGGYPAGTILATGNSWSGTFTKIDLYASTDRARTWKFVSHIAQGTAPNTTNGAHPIWEPRLLQYKNKLAAYYSDQRDPLYGQKLSHQESTDMINWGPVINDVALTPYEARPGMTNIVYIPPTKRWILVHETPVGTSSSYGQMYPVHYVMSDSPLTFGQNPDTPLVVNGTTAPNASPYVAWSPIGGPYGSIIVSDADAKQVFVNRMGGAVDAWEEHATPAGSVYSRAIQILKKRPNHLLIYGGDTYNGARAGEHIPFSVTAVKLKDVLKAPNATTYPYAVKALDDGDLIA